MRGPRMIEAEAAVQAELRKIVEKPDGGEP